MSKDEKTTPAATKLEEKKEDPKAGADKDQKSAEGDQKDEGKDPAPTLKSGEGDKKLGDGAPDPEPEVQVEEAPAPVEVERTPRYQPGQRINFRGTGAIVQGVQGREVTIIIDYSGMKHTFIDEE